VVIDSHVPSDRISDIQGWTAGDRLWTEAELTERLDVSRSVLREAINRLQMIGLVEIRRGLGVGDPDGLAACVQEESSGRDG